MNDWWKAEVQRLFKQVATENFEAGQADVRRKLMAKIDAVYPNETFSREEIVRYLEETGGELHEEDFKA